MDVGALSLYSRQKIEPRRREEREGGFCWFVIILEERPRITTHQALTFPNEGRCHFITLLEVLIYIVSFVK